MLYLAGGGDEKDSVFIDRAFASQLNGKRMLYLPIAMDGTLPTYEDCFTWIRHVFQPLGVGDITMWTGFDRQQAADFLEFGGIYIGGGNTFKLLSDLRRAGFDSLLKRFVHSGEAVYGGSAGAIIFGSDISTCSWMDVNEIGLVDPTGLCFMRDYAIWCHYTEQHDSLIVKFERPVIAIPERSGLSFDGTIATVIGSEGVAVFRNGSKRIMPPDRPFSLSEWLE